MSLKDEVKTLFDRKHELTNESCRRIDSCRRDGSIWNVDDLQPERSTIEDKLQSILNEGLQGDYTINGIKVEKEYADVTITNGVFVIPCNVRYKNVGLSSFVRKPGAKQILQRVKELELCLMTNKLIKQNKYVVGTSNLEAQQGSGWVVICRQISIVA